MDKQRNTPGLKIAAVERETGLGKDTLRVWERRYGFPAPARDEFGERCYSSAEVEKLRVVKRLLDAGHRPGALMPLSVEELQQLGQRHAAAARAPDDPAVDDELSALLDLLRSHELAELRRRLSQAQMRLGLIAFVSDVIAPLNKRVGEAWVHGTLDVYQEHSYTETVQRVLRTAIQGLNVVGDELSPRVLLSTLPGEPHGLGLLMAEALFAVDGAHCHSLGVQTPPSDLRLAVAAYRADVLALSFTACLGSHQVLDALAELRRMLPDSVQLWAGGSAPALRRCEIDGVQVLRGLDQIPGALRQWRAQPPRVVA